MATHNVNVRYTEGGEKSAPTSVKKYRENKGVSIPTLPKKNNFNPVGGISKFKSGLGSSFIKSGTAIAAGIIATKFITNHATTIYEAHSGEAITTNNIRRAIDIITNPIGTGINEGYKYFMRSMRIERENTSLDYHRALTGDLIYGRLNTVKK